MTARRFAAEALPLLLIALSWACSGAGAGPAGPASRLDADSEEGAPRRRTRQAQAVRPSEIPLLSLAGIPVPGGEEEVKESSEEGGGVSTEEAGENVQKDSQKGGEKAEAGSEAKPVLALPPRNLFAFEEDPAVVAERQRQAEEAAKQAEEAAKKAAEERAKREEEARLHPPPPQPPPVTFQYIGYFGPADDRIGVFALPGTPGVFLVKTGATVLDKFKVLEIGYESAEIGFVGFKETKRIPLVGGGK